MRPLQTTLVVTALVAIALGTWWGLYLFPVAFLGGVVFALRLLGALVTRRGGAVRELGWMLLCAAAIPLIFVARDIRIADLQDRWQPVVDALNDAESIDWNPRSLDEVTVAPDADCRYHPARDGRRWVLICDLTPPFERMTWHHESQTWRVWD